MAVYDLVAILLVGTVAKVVDSNEVYRRPDFSSWQRPVDLYQDTTFVVEQLGLECVDFYIKAGDQVKDGVPYACLAVGEAICIDNGNLGIWTFGLRENDDDGTPQACLWDDQYEAVWCLCAEYRTARVSHICIGEDTDYNSNKTSQERPYLIFYDDNIYENVAELTCDSTDGDNGSNLDKPTFLKMTDNSETDVNSGKYGKR